MDNFILDIGKNAEEGITNPQVALQYEWLETNGLGGYSSSTPYTCNTRKYHGLLALPIEEYGSRYVLVSKYLTSIIAGEKNFWLSTSRFPGVYHPDGHKYITHFKYENNIPRIFFKIGEIEIVKSIMMPRFVDGIIVKYEVLKSDTSFTLQINPLLPYREFHCLQKVNFVVNQEMRKTEDYWSISPYDNMPELFFSSNKKIEFHPAPDWYEDLEHLKEQERGYDFREDVFTPGVFESNMKKGQSLMLFASTQKYSQSIEDMWENENKRRSVHNDKIKKSIVSLSLKRNKGFVKLKENAHKFLIYPERKESPSIIAGFPWFGEWGRDTMISVAGLTLYNGEEELFFDILHTYLKSTKNALIPNQLNVYGESSYNSVDASLLFFWSLQHYTQWSERTVKTKRKTERKKALAVLDKHFGQNMKGIIKEFLSGSVPHVQLHDDGFLEVGSPQTQLTWMDAEVDGIPVTPRHGYPIDINALWYHALKLYMEMEEHKKTAPQKGDKKFIATIQKTIKSIEKNFETYYYMQDEQYLCDTIIDGRQIKEMRPNQLYALAIPYALVSDTVAKETLQTVKQALYKPLGLRTLCPSSIKYEGRYGGSQRERDAQYHQGCIWPFLLGIYTNTMLNVNYDDKKELETYKKELLATLQNVLYVKGIASIAEICDGDVPHKSRGCPFQAWSVAETIRSISILEEELS